MDKILEKDDLESWYWERMSFNAIKWNVESDKVDIGERWVLINICNIYIYRIECKKWIKYWERMI